MQGGLTAAKRHSRAGLPSGLLGRRQTVVYRPCPDHSVRLGRRSSAASDSM